MTGRITRQLKIVGVLVVAITAMSAVVASAASASNFGTESSPTFIKGEQVTKSVFTVEGGTVKCTGVTFTSAEITGTSVASLTIHPTYTGCTGFGQEATVSTTGCNYVFTASSTTTGNMTIECETGKEIVVTAKTAGCTVKIPAQTPTTNMVGYTNEGSGSTRSILVTPEVEGITYVSSGGICGPVPPGKYSGSVQLKGYGTSSFTPPQHGIFVESSNFGTESSPTFIKGEQVTKNVFTVEGGTVKCTGVTFTSAEITGTSVASLTIHPEYTGCTAFGSAATVATTGCNYVFTASSATTGNATIECETGKEIVVTVPAGSCTVKVPAQTPTTNMVGYTDEGSGSTRSILVKSEVEGITYTSSSSSSICGGSPAPGKYTGSVQLKGYGTSSFTPPQHGIFVE